MIICKQFSIKHLGFGKNKFHTWYTTHFYYPTKQGTQWYPTKSPITPDVDLVCYWRIKEKI